jgi:AcrR family transcriptional regulator
MPRSLEVLQQIRDDQRENILKAAQTVFARRGGAAAMAEIAEEAGISQGLAYRYFASKEELFSTLVKRSMQSADDYDKIIRKLPGSPAEKLRTIIERLLELRRERPGYYQFLYQMLNDESMPIELRRMMTKRGVALQREMRRLIVEGQKSGDIARDNPDQLLESVMACMEGLWRRMSYFDPEKSSEFLPDAKIIFRMLKPDKRGA